MSAWTGDELARIDATDEVQVSSYRADGTLRPDVTIWIVRVGDQVYVRSAYGPDNGWFRRAQASGTGRVRIGSVSKDVTFTEPGRDVHSGIDAAYHAKYDRYGPRIVGSVVGPQVIDVTVELIPRG